MSDKPKCELCGEPMPEGETIFKYHGYSGPCPKPPIPKPSLPLGALDRAFKETLARVESDPSLLASEVDAGTLTALSGQQWQVFVRFAAFDPALLESRPDTGGLRENA